MKVWWYFAGCQIVSFLLMLIALPFTALLCMLHAWKFPYAPSIKPQSGLILRTKVDGWEFLLPNSIYGNPEDGVSGVDAIVDGFIFNPTGSGWWAFIWNLRNYCAGFNYLTWRSEATPPLKTGTWLFGRPYKIGWQQLPASDGWVTTFKQRMVMDL